MATRENSAKMTPGSIESKKGRFGCGFVFGLVFTGMSGAAIAFTDGKLFVATTVLFSLIFGLAAMRYGDDFWRWVGNWFR